MKFKSAMTYLCAPILLGAVLLGCNQSTTTNSANEQSPGTELSSNPVNKVCPIMGGKVTSDGGSAEWDGKLIGFCCPECQPKWDELSEQEKSENLAAAEEKKEGGDEHGDHEHS